MAEIAKRAGDVAREFEDTALDADRRAFAEAFEALLEANLSQNPRRVERALKSMDTARRGRSELALRVGRAITPATLVEIVAHVTGLVSVMKLFPGLESKVYLRQLVADLHDERVSLGALVLGCRRVRQTCKNFPSIAEVLEAVRAVESDLRSAAFRIEEFGRLEAEAQEILGRPA